MDVDGVLQLIKAKERPIKITAHAQTQAGKRNMPIDVFRSDIAQGRPAAVEEKEAERQDERKFMLYYLQRGSIYHKYVISLNRQIYLITLMRVDKVRQKQLTGRER